MNNELNATNAETNPPAFVADCYIFQTRSFSGRDFTPAKVVAWGKATVKVVTEAGLEKTFNGTKEQAERGIMFRERGHSGYYSGPRLRFDVAECRDEESRAKLQKEVCQRLHAVREDLDKTIRSRITGCGDCYLTIEQVSIIEAAVTALKESLAKEKV